MKKYLFISSFLMLSLAASTLLISCGGGDDDVTQGAVPVVVPVTPEVPETNKTLSQTEQKKRLEQVALSFMNQTPSGDFADIASLCKYFNDVYVNEYDWEVVQEWAEDALDAARQALGTGSEEHKTESWGSYGYHYNYIYTDFASLIEASNFCGHFTASNGKWVYEKADNLQFFFTDKMGKQCAIRIETSGHEVKAHLYDKKNYKGSDSKESYQEYTISQYYDRIAYTVRVPEHISVILSQGGSEVIKTTVDIDLSNLIDTEVDISQVNLTASIVVEMNNGYRFDISRVSYTGNTSAYVDFFMTKNGKILLSAAVSGDVNKIPSVNVSALASEKVDKDVFDNSNGRIAYAKVDILGEVQIQGVLSDIRKYIDYINEAADNKTSESTYKSYINQANSLTDICLFYDGSGVKQANVRLESFSKEKWNGSTYWEAEPIIEFYDGSSYSTIEAFFNEIDFKQTTSTFKTLVNQYAALLDLHVDW